MRAGHHGLHREARRRAVKALRFAPTPFGAGGLDSRVGRATRQPLRDVPQVCPCGPTTHGIPLKGGQQPWKTRDQPERSGSTNLLPAENRQRLRGYSECVASLRRARRGLTPRRVNDAVVVCNALRVMNRMPTAPGQGEPFHVGEALKECQSCCVLVSSRLGIRNSTAFRFQPAARQTARTIHRILCGRLESKSAPWLSSPCHRLTGESP